MSARRASRHQQIEAHLAEIERIRNELFLSVRGIVVREAKRIATRSQRVAVEDLVQVGSLAVLDAMGRFSSGRAPGKSLFPGWVAMVSRQRMVEWAQGQESAATVARSARRSAAKSAARAEEVAQACRGKAFDPRTMGGVDSRSALAGLLEGEEAFGVAEAIELLSERARLVIRWTYGLEGRVQARDGQIAKRLKIEPEEVEEIRSRALERIRAHLERD
jgi:RNA polymerase sigma factor (sigma-70 family)